MESRPKSIFIVEGKHDSPFISALLIDKYKIVQLHKVCLFFKNEGNKKRKYGKETEALRDLFAQSSPFSYLVKSEGGKSFVLPLLGSIIVEMVMDSENMTSNVYCMVDLDDKAEEKQLAEIITTVKSTLDKLSIIYNISKINDEAFLGRRFIKFYYEIKVHYDKEELILPLTVLLANPTLESIVSKHFKISKNKVDEVYVKKFTLYFKNELSGLI